MTRHPSFFTLAALPLALFACDDSLALDRTSPPGQPDIGDDSFVSAVPGGSRSLNDAAGAPAADNDRQTGSDREIEEADVIRLDGNLLYVLNAYRGLEIIDVSNPDAPLILGNARVFGYPVEMYVEGTRAYIVVSNYFTYWAFALDDAAEEWRGSQLVVVDIANPALPQVLSRFNVEGYITNTRRVGDVLYVVSNRYAWWSCTGSTDTVDLTFVGSFDIYDPSNIHAVQQVDFPGSSNFIHVTTDALFVAQYRWDWNGAATTYGSDVTYVDISDPTGIIAKRGTFGVPGYLFDRYAMDWFNDSFRIVTYFWEGGGHSELATFDTTNPDAIAPQGTLRILDAGFLMATRFDGTRAYTVHLPRSNIDPLDVIDLSDPSNPRLTAVLEIPGWVSHLEVRSNRLLALGVDDTAWPRRASVKLFDVTDLAAPALLAETPIGDGQSWSQADWDPKALTILDDQGLILVPFSSWSNNVYTNGVQLISYVGDTLQARGVLDSDSWVTRTREVSSRLVALSTEFLEVYDASDLDHPVKTAALELAWNVADFVTLGNYGVQLVGDYWDYYGNTHRELRVVSLSDPDQGPVLARLPLTAPYGRMFQNGSFIYVASTNYDPVTYTSTTHVQVYDFADPLNPVARGDIDVPVAAYDYWGGMYWSWWWYAGGEVVSLGDRLIFHAQNWYWYLAGDAAGSSGTPNANSDPDEIYVVDLANPDALASTRVGLPEVATRMSGRDDTVFYTYYVPVSVPDSPYTWAAYHLGRIDVSDASRPQRLPGVNIPGQFLDASSDASILYTLDWSWNADGSITETFNTLRTAGGHAVLLGRLQLSDPQSYLTGLAIKDGIAYSVRQSWGGACDAPPALALEQIDARDPSALSIASTFTVQGYGWLLDVEAQRAFLSTGWGEGLLVVDVADPSAPALLSSLRTQGYPVAVRVANDSAFLPSGYYGVQAFSLDDGSAL